MARGTVAPASREKIGRKIEYLIAAHVAPALAPHGFRRKARTLFRESGADAHRCLAVVNLQGHRSNEGSRGTFCVNLGVQLPAVTRLIAEIPHLDWMADHAESNDESACLVRGRIDSALPERREAWWPEGLQRGQDFWFEIGTDTDLAALGRTLARLVVEYALPWLDARASLESLLVVRDAGFGAASPLARIAAALLLGRPNEAQAVVDDPALWLAPSGSKLEAVKAWACRHGLDVSRRSYVAPPTPPGIAARAESLRAKRDALAAQAAAFLEDPAPIAARLDDFLDAFLAEGRSVAAAERDMSRLRLWSVLRGESDETCRALVLRALERLVTAPTSAESVEDNVWGSVAFVHDYFWGELIEALLARPLPATEAFSHGVLDRLRQLAGRVHEQTTTVVYPFPLVRLVRYLDREAGLWREALRPAVAELLAAITAAGWTFAADERRAIAVLRQWAESSRLDS